MANLSMCSMATAAKSGMRATFEKSRQAEQSRPFCETKCPAGGAGFDGKLKCDDPL